MSSGNVNLQIYVQNFIKCCNPHFITDNITTGFLAYTVSLLWLNYESCILVHSSQHLYYKNVWK